MGTQYEDFDATATKGWKIIGIALLVCATWVVLLPGYIAMLPGWIVGRLAERREGKA